MSDYASYLDIPYPSATDTRQALDLFIPPHADHNSPLIVFIHGGAWRSESKSDFTNTLVPNFLAATSLPLAVVEYRLAPLHPHPAQILDVLAALALLASPSPLPGAESPSSLKWSRRKLHLVGHSAGAFMALSALLVPPPPPHPHPHPLAPEFAVPPTVRAAIASVVCSEGIYDLPGLLEEYPAYAGFVGDAFGTDAGRHERESPGRWRLPGAEEAGAVRILVLHSREDELLSLRQPDEFVARVRALLEEAGPKQGKIEVDYDTLKGKHDEVPLGRELPAAVARWVAQVETEQ